MHSGPRDVAQIRLDNALALFDEFVSATIKHPDAATLRGLERRFAERLQIQPSYWSQIKSRSRQIGERLARQFEQQCHKPSGWMDLPHTAGSQAAAAPTTPGAVAPASPVADDSRHSQPQDEDERFIVGLVLTYYRRHPQRARARLLGLLGEVLAPTPPAPIPGLAEPVARGRGPGTGGAAGKPAAAEPAKPAPTPAELWAQTQANVAPLKKKR